MNFKPYEKYVILYILSKIMKADGIINPKEQEYMNRMYEQWGITIQEISIIMDLDLNSCVHIYSEMSADKKKTARQYFEEMAEADGFVDPRELNVIRSLTLKD